MFVVVLRMMEYQNFLSLINGKGLNVRVIIMWNLEYFMSAICSLKKLKVGDIVFYNLGVQAYNSFSSADTVTIIKQKTPTLLLRSFCGVGRD